MKILGERKVLLSMPRLNSEQDRQVFITDLIQEFSSVNIYEKRAFNLSVDGIIFKRLSIDPLSFIWNHQKKYFNKYYILKQHLFCKKTIIKEDLLICFDNWSIGYYHWMCDFLPRYLLCKEFVSYDIKIVLPFDFNREYIVQTLEIFGKHTIKYLNKGEYLSVEKILISDRPSPSGRVDKALMNKIKSGIKQHWNIDDANPIRKIYISRNKASRRRLSNNQEIEAVFLKYGYEIICFEEYSFEDQIRIVSSSRIMAGLHGANLVNSMFMNKGMDLFEFRLKEFGGNAYFNISEAFELNYHYCISPTAPEILDDIYMDPKFIEEVLIRDKLY